MTKKGFSAEYEFDYEAIRRSREDRYLLQFSASRILPQSRVARCGRVLAVADTAIYRSSFGTCFFSGPFYCSLIWICPICSAKASERRKLILQTAIDKWMDSGGFIFFVTATIPHDAFDLLSDILDRMLFAWTSMVKLRHFSFFRRRWGLAGFIRGLECTFGRNGWHPHIHALFFLRSDASAWALAGDLSDMWQSRCLASGLGLPGDAHGLRVDRVDGAAIAAYLSGAGQELWGPASELVKGHSKRSRGGGLSPWDLLRCYAERGEPQFAALFSEYAQAFKGKHQLGFSHGLRQLLGVSDATDAQLIAEWQDSAERVFTFDPAYWRIISRDPAEIPRILHLAERSPVHLPYYFQLLGKDL